MSMWYVLEYGFYCADVFIHTWISENLKSVLPNTNSMGSNFFPANIITILVLSIRSNRTSYYHSNSSEKKSTQIFKFVFNLCRPWLIWPKLSYLITPVCQADNSSPFINLQWSFFYFFSVITQSHILDILNTFFREPPTNVTK